MPEQTQNFPNREQIERRAYEIYLRHGGVDGSDVADWIMAEEELKATLKARNLLISLNRKNAKNS